MSDQAQQLREAWWGGNRSLGGRPMPVHLVNWEAGRRHGYALCRALIGLHGARETGIQVYPLGTAKAARVEICGPCTRALAKRAPSAPVVPIQQSRRKKVTQ